MSLRQNISDKREKKLKSMKKKRVWKRKNENELRKELSNVHQMRKKGKMN